MCQGVNQKHVSGLLPVVFPVKSLTINTCYRVTGFFKNMFQHIIIAQKAHRKHKANYLAGPALLFHVGFDPVAVGFDKALESFGGGQQGEV